MVLTNVFFAVGALTISTFVYFYELTCNYSKTVIALLDSVANDICFTLNLGSIFEVIFKARLPKNFLLHTEQVISLPSHFLSFA